MRKRLRRQLMQELGRIGAKASNASRTPEQRRELARKAVKTRWDRVRAAKELPAQQPA